MNFHSEALQALRGLLQTGDEADRCYSARTLGAVKDPDAIKILIERLRDEDIDVCVDAAEALGKIGDTSAIPALIESLQNEQSGEICTSVTNALATMGGEEAISALINVALERPEALEWEDDWDTWWDVQLEAVKGMGNSSETRVVEPLMQILNDETSQDIEAEILTAIAKVNGEGASALIKRLTETTLSRERRRAAKALSKVDTNEATRALGRALTDEAGDVRGAAAIALAEKQATKYLPAIILLLRDPDADARDAALQATNLMMQSLDGSESFVEQLEELLSDPSEKIRATTYRLLAENTANNKLSSKAVEQVALNLADVDFTVASAAAYLLGKNGDASISEQLIELANDTSKNPMPRSEAALALGELRQSSTEIISTLTCLIDDDKEVVRLSALAALNKLAPHFTANEDAETEENPSPIDILIATLNGEISFKPEADEVITPEAETEDDDNQASEEADMPLPETAGEIVQEGDVQKAVSTLDAIAMENVEAALAADVDEPEVNILETDEELSSFIDVMEKNEEVEKRMASNVISDIAQDARCMAARILAGNEDEQVISALLNILNTEKDQLQTEAIIAISDTAQINPNAPGLMNAVGSLITLLGMGAQNQRLASARALGNLRNKTSIKPLLDTLKDEVPEVRIAAIQSIVDLTLHGADPEKADHMVILEAPPRKVYRELSRMIKDETNSVRIAAAIAMTQLLSMSDTEADADTVLEEIIEAGFSGAGEQARQMGQLACNLNLEKTVSNLLDRLQAAEESSERRFIIEMLEESFKPREGAVS